ncbi:MAG: hypothetical protein R3C24_13660 [Cyanobacteriota/Melainabacteria group bacterium]
MELILEQTRPAEDRPFYPGMIDWERFMHENYLTCCGAMEHQSVHVCFCMVETVDRHCGYDGLTRLEEALRKA